MGLRLAMMSLTVAGTIAGVWLQVRRQRCLDCGCHSGGCCVVCEVSVEEAVVVKVSKHTEPKKVPGAQARTCQNSLSTWGNFLPNPVVLVRWFVTRGFTRLV